MYFDKYSPILAKYVISQYTGTQGDNNLYYHDSNLTTGAGDNSYRYAGASDSVNNFVCFGTDATTCLDDNLYRIIGVFEDQVKLIKWDYANSNLLGIDGEYVNTYNEYVIPDFGVGLSGTNKGPNSTSSIGVYHWNSSGTNLWSTSELNTINLNINYINNIGGTWANKIAETTWKVGGNTASNISGATPANAYKNEYTNPAENTTVSSKIGLMYTSDYGFAASPSAWTTTLSSYNSSSITSVNWMYMGLQEWTIIKNYSDDNDDETSFFIYNGDSISDTHVSFIASAVRPVFYLNSDVEYSSGTGTKNDPIRIKID